MKVKHLLKGAQAFVLAAALSMGAIPLPSGLQLGSISAYADTEAPTEITSETTTWSEIMVVKENVIINGNVTTTGDNCFITIEPDASLTVNGNIDASSIVGGLGICGEGRFTVNGSVVSANGTFHVNGGYVNITSDQYCIKAIGVDIEGGILDLKSTGDTAYAIEAESEVHLYGGALKAENRGQGSAIKCRTIYAREDGYKCWDGNSNPSIATDLGTYDMESTRIPFNGKWLATGYTAGSCGSTANGGNVDGVKYEIVEHKNKPALDMEEYDANTLILSGEGKIASYEIDKEVPWNAQGDRITDVLIGKSVSGFGDDQIKNINPLSVCTNLKSITVEQGNNDCCSIDGVLYTKTVCGPYYLLFCPCKKTGSITIPNTVRGLYEGSFYATNGGKVAYTSLSEIRFEKSDNHLSILTEKFNTKSAPMQELFGKGYEGDCRFVASDGNVIGLKVNKITLEATPCYSSVAVKEDWDSRGVHVRPVSEWDKKQAEVSGGGTVTLTEDWNYQNSSYNYTDSEGETSYCGVLSIPANTTLDLNGHTLTATQIKPHGDLTVKNGKLICTFAGDDDLLTKSSTLTLSKVDVTALESFVGELNSSFNWGGEVNLTDSTVTITGNGMNLWMPPTDGKMLTLDGSSFTIPQTDFGTLMGGDSLYMMALCDGESDPSEQFQSQLG
ncbi:MAG: hypothetical protein K6E19_04090, partial [Lachnospiraceae bacterium]|nr:hypothetical protein [Lachnospiraceae bacterium]